MYILYSFSNNETILWSEPWIRCWKAWLMLKSIFPISLILLLLCTGFKGVKIKIPICLFSSGVWSIIGGIQATVQDGQWEHYSDIFRIQEHWAGIVCFHHHYRVNTSHTPHYIMLYHVTAQYPPLGPHNTNIGHFIALHCNKFYLSWLLLYNQNMTCASCLAFLIFE